MIITILFILFILGLAIWGGITINKEFSSLKGDLKKIDQDLDMDQLKHPILIKNWELYQRSFMKGKTHEKADGFFNEDTIIKDRSNLSNISNILVGLGILGTFTGLAFGLSGFNMESTEGIMESINDLLTGVDTSFYTSIGGMLTSIIYGAYFKYTMAKTNNLIGDLCHSLDAEYKFTEEDKLQREYDTYLSVQKAIVEEYYCSTDEFGNIIYPKDRMKNIHEQLTDNTASIRSMSTDLSLVLKEGLADMVEEINESLNDMVNRLVDMTSNQTDTSIKEVMESIKVLLAGFNSSLSEPLVELANKMDTVGNSVNELPSVVKSMKTTFDEIIKDFGATVFQIMKEREKSELDSKGRTDEIITQTSQISKDLTTSFDQLLSDIREIIESSKEASSEMNKTANEFNTSGNYISKATEELTKTSNTFNDTSVLIQDFTKDFSSSAKDVVAEQSGAMLKMHQITEDFAKVSESMDKLPMTIDSLKATVDEILQGFDKNIKQGMEGGQTINQNAANQLKELSELLGETKGSYHSEINKVMKEFNDMLHNTKEVAGEMKDSADVFNQSGGKMKEASSELLQTVELLDGTSVHLKEFGLNTTNTANKQLEATALIKDNVESSIDVMKNAGVEMQEKIKGSVVEMNNYSHGLEGAEQKLGEAFSVLHNHMESYNTATKNVLNEQLTNFTKEFTDSTSILHEAVSNLTDMVDDLQETVAKRK